MSVPLIRHQKLSFEIVCGPEVVFLVDPMLKLV
jgi:hypothetical protein